MGRWPDAGGGIGSGIHGVAGMRYEVTIRAKITKTFTVDAVDEDMAMAQANEMFTPELDGEERYEQFVLNVEQA